MTLTPLQAALGIFGGMAIVMLLLWLRQTRTRNAGVVDVAWSYGIGAAVLFYAWVVPGFGPRKTLVAALAAVWSLRLGTHILHRVTRESEDGRYQTMREWAGAKANAVFFWFFQFQAGLVVLFALPQLIALQNPTPTWRWLDTAAIVLALLAFGGEALADRQLAAFRANPENKGKVCGRGFWRYSRHPNYFFEWLHWWAYCLIAIGFTPWGWLTLLGPALMYVFLMYVTGVPWTEMQALKSRGDAYRRYQESTSVFFPWPPKETAETAA